jgi:hypothetical protein
MRVRLWKLLAVVAIAVLLFLGYVLSAPLVLDKNGLPLRIYEPVWSAAREGPASKLLRQYFRMCGIEFAPYAAPENTRETYE